LFCYQPFEEHEREKMGSVVAGAVITSNGKLTKDFEYIADLRKSQERVTIPGDFHAQKKVFFFLSFFSTFSATHS
jgi:hypothetical protein